MYVTEEFHHVKPLKTNNILYLIGSQWRYDITGDIPALFFSASQKPSSSILNQLQV